MKVESGARFEPPRMGSPVRLRLRTRLARQAAVAATKASRRLGRRGSVIGGHVLLRLDPDAIADLSASLAVCLVSGTNGKTTTTALVAAAASDLGPVCTNRDGANLRTGVAAALALGPSTGTAVLEVDEATLPSVLADTAAGGRSPVVVLLNLSRDQLDRYGEVRTLAARWRRALTDHPTARVVANADDPLVVWAASASPAVTWVGAGHRWGLDAVACPACGEHLRSDGKLWSCRCGLARPAGHECEPHVLRLTDGAPIDLTLRLPGRHNQANAAMAIVAARHLGADPATATVRMAEVEEVAGRYLEADVRGTRARFLLAKNPAGWLELLSMLTQEDQKTGGSTLVLALNARAADGRDPSWIWDVDLEALRGRDVVACGDRARDLSVRLAYAGVEHRVASGSVADALADLGDTEVDVVANYSAFADAIAAIDAVDVAEPSV